MTIECHFEELGGWTLRVGNLIGAGNTLAEAVKNLSSVIEHYNYEPLHDN